MRELPRLPKFPGSSKPERSDRLRSCDVCGQTFDTENLDHVFYHDADPHQSLSEDLSVLK